MLKLITIASFMGVSMAAKSETFKWNKNNDFSNPENWVSGGVPIGNADLSRGCIAHFGKYGGSVSMDMDHELGRLTLPDDGAFVLEDSIKITFNDQVDFDQVTEWRCKNVTEYLTTCSDNFVMQTADGWVPADTAPCYNDVIQIEDGASTSVMWGSGQYLRSVDLTDDNNNVVRSIRHKDDLKKYDKDYPRIFQGVVPEINEIANCGGETQCQMLCVDMCPARELTKKGVADRDDFFTLTEETRDLMIEGVRVDQDALNAIRFDATKALKSNAGRMITATEDFQTTYDTAMKAANYTKSTRNNGDVTIEVLKITSAQMANWMDAYNVGDIHAIHYLRHSLTKKLAQDTLDFFGDVESGNGYYGVEEEPDTYKAMRLDDELWEAIDAKGFTRGGRLARRGVYNNVMAFLLADVNDVLSRYTDATRVQVLRFGVLSAVANDAELDFDHATGAFLLKNVVVNNPTTYVDDKNNVLSGVAPTIIEVAMATSLTRMALFARAEALRLTIHFRPTTTWSPTTSPTANPTSIPTALPTMTPTFSPTKVEVDALAGNLIPIAAGGAGGLLLIILIIVLIIVILGGRKNSDDKNDNKSAPQTQRDVIAFENPMYDDPKHNQQHNQQYNQQHISISVEDDGDLYDEPTFRLDEKANPMYQSNEDVVGANVTETDTDAGYLDVTPDDDEEDEEEEEDEDEDEDDEDEDE